MSWDIVYSMKQHGYESIYCLASPKLNKYVLSSIVEWIRDYTLTPTCTFPLMHCKFAQGQSHRQTSGDWISEKRIHCYVFDIQVRLAFKIILNLYFKVTVVSSQGVHVMLACRNCETEMSAIYTRIFPYSDTHVELLMSS